MPPLPNLWLRRSLLSLNLQKCACCGSNYQNVAPASSANQWICNYCDHLIRADTRAACRQCGLRLGKRLQAFGWQTCRHCRNKPNPHIQTTVVQDYIPPFSNWVLELKYSGNVTRAQMLADFLLETIKQENQTLPDVLVPSPISSKRLKKRGYNQAELLAKHLGKKLKIPVQSNWLKKIKDTAQQSNSTKHQRELNLRNSIICTQALPDSIKIGLVDDVITTGSTLNTCAEVMRKAGARYFQFYAICRTPE